MKQGLPRSNRVALIERDLAEKAKVEAVISLSRQAKLLGVSRASLYYKPVGSSAREVELKHRIDAIYTQYPFYGYRCIHQQLVREGYHLNRKTVQTYMREMGLQAIYPGPNLSKRDLQHRVYPYLLRSMVLTRPRTGYLPDLSLFSFQNI